MCVKNYLLYTVLFVSTAFFYELMYKYAMSIFISGFLFYFKVQATKNVQITFIYDLLFFNMKFI